MAASALVSSGRPGCAAAGWPVATTGNASAKAATASSALNVGDLDGEPEQLRAVPEEVGIAEQVECGEFQLIPAQPRRDGDIGPDTRGFA